MSDNDEIEMDVDKYTVDELYAILRLHPRSSPEDVRATASRMINKMLSKGDIELAHFFRNIQARLLSEGMTQEQERGRDFNFDNMKEVMDENMVGNQDEEDDDEDYDDISELSKRQGLTTDKGSGQSQRQTQDVVELARQRQKEIDERKQRFDKAKNVINKNNGTDIFDKAGNYHYVKPQTLGIRQTFPVEVAQGENNPNLVNTTKYSLVVDSRLRSNIFPYNADNPNTTTSSTSFDVTLSNPLRECISLELNSVCVPKSWYNIDAFLGTNVLWINDVPLEVESGFYTPVKLAEALTAAATLPLTDVSYNTVTGKFSLNFMNIDPTPLDVKIVFWDRAGDYTATGTTCTTQAIPNARLDYNLGYLMGFREPGPLSSISFTIGVSPNNLRTETGKATADLEGTKNLYIMVEDHNQNRLNNQILPMAQVEQQIIQPTAFLPTADLSYACLEDEQIPFYYNNTPGSGVTKAQLFTINAIASNQTITKDRVNGPQQANILGVLPVSSYDVEWGRNIIVSSAQMMTNKRVYFGPVSLNKFNVKLIDDIGNIVNLNGRDWSFTATAVSLYQY
jgi:hypothetical protein